MRKLFLLFALTAGIVWAQDVLYFEYDLDKLDKNDLKKVVVEEDKFKNLTFIKPKNTAGSIVYPYIVVSGDKMFLRVVTSYSGSNWIYFKKFYAILDGVKYEYDVNNITTTVDNGRVYERSDMPVDQYLIDYLYAYADLKSAEEIRYEGETKVSDMNDVLKKTRNRIKDLLTIFEKIKK